MPTPVASGPWTQEDWDSYWSENEAHLTFTQHVQFGETSELVAGFAVVDTLQQIRGHLHDHVFSTSGLLAWL